MLKSRPVTDPYTFMLPTWFLLGGYRFTRFMLAWLPSGLGLELLSRARLPKRRGLSAPYFKARARLYRSQLELRVRRSLW